jgi:hypothetical protein
MKIDLGRGSIESYNFNLMSSNIVINAKGEGLNNSYFTVFAKSKPLDLTDKEIFEAFSVKKDGHVVFAGTWTVKPGILMSTGPTEDYESASIFAAPGYL